MAIVTGDRYLERLVRFVGRNAGLLLEGSLTLKLNPVGLHYVQTRLEALRELEGLLAGAPVDYLRAYVSDLGDHRALEQLRRILRLLTSLKVVAVLPPPVRDPTPLSLLPFSRLRFLELRGCDLSTSAARGLLELRHTLEKLICHNSTDALRHVFASRIADIKESPAWNRLSFVSCAFNGLVLMDESLQLLPVVESMDLSRNRFAKLDNLRKCVRLRNLDLGFNHLRSIALLSEVPCPIVKLVLRNNVLATLHGLENLKLLEGLDLSYNIISSFSELEILASLSCLENLWLEGNPICCARWYRAHVFSFFSHPEKLKLDDKGISTNEYWERQIIFAKRQKQPAGYGFYFPAKDDAEEGSVNTKRRKHYSRLANIEDDEHRRYYCSDSVDQESVSGDSDSLRKDENATSEGDSEIVDLMNRVEYMKKEHSDHWLREFKEWLGQTSEDMIDGSQCVGFNRDPAEEKYVQDRKSRKHLGESSKFAPDIGPVSEDGNSSSILESDISLTDPGGYGKEYFDTSGPTVSNGGDISRTAITRAGVNSEQGHLNLHLRGRENLSHLEVNGHSNYGSSVDHIDQKISPAPLTAIDELIRSPSLVNPGSPPHYEQDILDRRLYLEEEFLQLSAESISLASSDSDTSCSDAESCEFLASIPDLHSKLIPDSTKQDFSDQLNILHPNVGHEDTCLDEKIGSTSDCCSEPEYILQHQGKPFCGNNIFNVLSCGEIDQVMGQDDGGLEKQKATRKSKRRIALVVDNFAVHNTETTSQGSNGISGIGKADLNTQIRPISNENYVRDTCEQAAMVLSHNLEGMNLRTGDAYGPLLKTKPSSANPIQDDIIKDFFNSKLADSRNSETCLELVWCGCMFQLASSFKESEVALLRSCKNNLCILSTEAELDEQGNIFKVVGFHRLEDVREIIIGLGLQALRICMEGDATYLLLPRTVEKSNNILYLLQVDDSCALNSGCSLQSWEQVQIKLLEKHIGRNLKMNLFLYSMLLFSHDNCEGESWEQRSLIVIEGNMLLCYENIGKFGSSIDDCESSPPYYSLDSCCPIQNILEMVIEFKDVSWTLTLYYVTSSICNTDMVGNNRLLKNKKDQVIVWKLKWSSGDTLQKFLELIKAMYSGLTLSSLPVKCVS